jgi:hypothetical protein
MRYGSYAEGFFTIMCKLKYMTFNMEAGVVRRIRSVFRKKAEETTTAPEKTAESEWVSIRTMLMRVLGKFPEAKEAVVQGLMELRGIDPAWAT